MADRIPCINPRCRRTAPAERYEPDAEIICGKCFRSLPEEVRKEHRWCWSQYRKWERRIKRTVDELKLRKMQSIRDMWGRRINDNWGVIKAALTCGEQPEGIDNFLKEIGLVR